MPAKQLSASFPTVIVVVVTTVASTYRSRPPSYITHLLLYRGRRNRSETNCHLKLDLIETRANILTTLASMLPSFLNGRSRRPDASSQSPPFPSRQLFILALCRICEPIAFMSIFPYVYYMISSFQITNDDRQIAVYVGLVTSSFAFAEFSTSVIWGRLSDRIGRKPVLIMGLAGTAISMMVFGFATNLPTALLGRALGGLLNGNIGVLQTTVAEIVTVKEHQPRAYSIMPFVWCIGSILGPALGGALAQPCDHYPWLFSNDSIFAKYPFLLPNVVCISVLVCGVVVGILFLEETHPEKKHQRDLGLQIGRWIVSKLTGKEDKSALFSFDKAETMDEVISLLEDEQPPGYRTSEGSPRTSTSHVASEPPPVSLDSPPPKALRGHQKAFTKAVLLNIVGYGLLAYHSVSFDQLMPVFLSEPVSHDEVSLPFKFTGGFGLSSKTIGFMLAVQGVYSMIAQLFIFPYIVKRFGTLNTFRFTIMTWPILYFAVPYVVLLPTSLQKPAVYVCLIWKITAHVMAFPSNAILLTNSAPSTMVLGLINGVAASTASLARAFGPTITGIIHSAGLQHGYTGLAWWASGAICFLGAIETLWMEEGKGRLDSNADDVDEEAGLRSCRMNSISGDTALLPPSPPTPTEEVTFSSLEEKTDAPKAAGTVGQHSDSDEPLRKWLNNNISPPPYQHLEDDSAADVPTGSCYNLLYRATAPMTSPSSASSRGLKRAYPSSDESSSPTQPRDAPSRPEISLASASHAVSSAFRNVSACNRCRVRKNRCDQRLPACASCEKAHVKCVGYDPILKREIPRSYVYYLESRISYLETLLQSNNIPFKLPEAYDAEWSPPARTHGLFTPADDRSRPQVNGNHVVKVEPGTESSNSITPTPKDPGLGKKQDDDDKLNKLVSNIGMVSVQGASDPRYLGSTSGISFARVVFQAVKNSVSSSGSDRSGVNPSKPLPPGAGSTSMRDSFFGLQSKPTIKKAPFPERELAEKLVNLYFEHANPQIPILHRGEFMSLFNRVYSIDDKSRTPRELYLLNIVFAIGSGIIFGGPDSQNPDDASNMGPPSGPSPNSLGGSPSAKRQRIFSQQSQPEEYHASAIVHLETFLGSGPAADRPDGFGGGLEELQAVLLLAGFALLRPVAPGLWYIVGVAVRLAVDLGLHYEDGTGGDTGPEAKFVKDAHMSIGTIPMDTDCNAPSLDPRERGRREWVRDLRRRLWWCVYSFDRLVSTCVGRPFGITDQVITTQFPSALDDKYITTGGFVQIPGGAINAPSYKRVSYHYFRLRLLQSEILNVLQYQQAQQVFASGIGRNNEYMHTKLPSPFLQHFDSFRSWRRDIDRRLWEWKESAPCHQETGVAFSPQFLELNYWQAVIMLYRQSLSVPAPLAGEMGQMSPAEDVSSPSMMSVDSREEEEDVFLKVAEAGQKVLRLYRQLHRLRLTLDDVDFTVLAATSVLGDLIAKCPPAEACRDAFERMSKATVQMCLSTTGFASQAPGFDRRPGSQSASPESTHDQNMTPQSQQMAKPRTHGRRPPPRFDMNLRDLFTEENINNRQPLTAQFSMMMPTRQQQYPPPQPSIQQAFMPPPQQMSPHSYRMPTTSAATPPNGLPAGFEPTMQRHSPQQQQPLMTPPLRHQQQQQHQQQPSFFTTTSTTTSGPYQTTGAGMDFGANGYTGMDFLNEGLNHQDTGNNIGVGGVTGLDFGFGLGGGLNLGEPENHDWTEGGGVDLFDGFFFGGGVGNGGGM
ncbi:MAG: Fungal specific transcription factor [Cirrosporium novae-zelandiae]|nr:MAG: Fungal specific transcription factor [Cirrosporium novae-zelandiae]